MSNGELDDPFGYLPFRLSKLESDAGLPRLVMLGNCQMFFLAYLIQGCSPGLKVLSGPVPGPHEGPSHFAVGADAVVTQVTPFDAAQPRPFGADPSQSLVRVPNVMLTYLWPFTSNNAGNAKAERTWRIFTPSPALGPGVVDSKMVETVAASATVEEAIASYMARDIAAESRVDRVRRLNVGQVEAVSRSVGSTIHELFADHPTNERSFHNLGHPTAPITLAIFEHVLNGLTEAAPSIAALIPADEVRQAVVGANGMHLNLMQTPVHPSIAEHFGLTWLERPDLVNPDYRPMAMKEYLETLVRTEFLFKVLADGGAPVRTALDLYESHPYPRTIFDGVAAKLAARGDAAAGMDLLVGQEAHLRATEPKAVIAAASRLLKRRFLEGARWVLETGLDGREADSKTTVAHQALAERLDHAMERRRRRAARSARRARREAAPSDPALRPRRRKASQAQSE